jgi:hypothetical protein
MSNRASPASAAVAISLLAVFPGAQSFAETKAAETAPGSMPVATRAPASASTAASDPASAPVTLAPSTPDIFFPPAPARAPAPTFSLSGTPARVSPSAPSSNSASAPASGSAPGSVSGTAPAPDEDIRDIRGPKGMLPPWLIPALLAGAALLVLGGYAAWRRHRRSSRPRVLLPFEAALQRLEDIRRLLDPASAREFSIAVSDIVRQYIEVQFMVTATHRTTEEFLRDLLETSNAALAAHRNLLAEFLNQCDLAKFAGVSLSRQILESLHRSARGFVTESSKPPPAADAREAPPVRIKEVRDSLPST